MKPAFAQDVSDLVRKGVGEQLAGRLDAAEKLLGAAAALAAQDWEPQFRLALLALQRGRNAEARERLERLVGGAAPAADLHYALGRAHKAAGDLTRAVEHYAVALQAAPDRSEVRVSLAIALRAMGGTDEAEAELRRALELKPDFPEALVNLGRLLVDAGRAAEAVPLLARAGELRPRLAEAWFMLGEAMRATDRPVEAATAFFTAGGLRPDLARDPRHGQAWLAAGDWQRETGDYRAAEAAYRRALELLPEHVAALNNLAALRVVAGDHGEAVGLLRRAAAVEPDAVDIHQNLGVALNDLGDSAGAIASLQHAVALDPGNRRALVALANALRLQNRFAEGELPLRRALALDPGDAIAHSTLGTLYIDQGRFAEAENAMRAALEVAPESGDVLTNMGVALYMLGRPEEALPWFDRAIELAPELYRSRFSRGIACLKLGRMAEGWDGFEWRFRSFEKLGASLPKFPTPRWAGEPLRGRTILLHGEQGLGDELQFVRFAPLVAARGGRVWLLCQKPLVRLFERMDGVERVFGLGDQPPPFDLHCPLLSLPQLLRIGLDGMAMRDPYLAPTPADLRAWGRRIGDGAGLKVGLVWSGNPRPEDREANLTDARRSLKLSQFAPLARVSGVRWFSLQKGRPASDEARSPPPGMALEDPAAELGDFADTAALAANLDLVIAVDTSVVHLAGALGKPVWMLSRFDGCWRWMMDRADSPWYPTLRIFRQQAPLDWAPAIEEIAVALERLAQQRRSAA